MPIGVGAAMLIGSAVSGGAAVGAAALQSKAAKDAAKKQQAGTDRALQVQQQANAPYLQLGQQAAQALQNRPQEPFTQQFRPGSGNTGFQPQMPQGAPPMTLGSIGQPNGMGAPQVQPSGGMVLLSAPDGSVTKPVPSAVAAQFLARGYKRVG